MNKFWSFAAAVLVIGAGFVAFTAFGNNQNVQINDLETECRISEKANVDVGREGNKITFEGHYPENDSDAKLSYSYSQSDDSITLNVKSRTRSNEVNFIDGCLASVVYSAETSELEPGIYSVEVRHDGVKAAETSLRVPE